PAIVCNTIAASFTDAASGPTWSSEVERGITPRLGTRPYVGFNPTHPQSAAGSRIEPAVSVPIAAQHTRAITAAADPPDAPPVILPISHGLRVSPKWLISELPP